MKFKKQAHFALRFIVITFYCYRAEIRPCENILCSKDISEKRTKSRSLIENTRVWPIWIREIPPVFTGNVARNMKTISLKQQCHDIYSLSLISIGFDKFHSMMQRAKLLHGEIEIQSKPMQGTKICIRLPYKDNNSGPKENQIDSSRSNSLGQIFCTNLISTAP